MYRARRGGSGDRKGTAAEEDPTLNVEMLSLLENASAHPDGQVSIERSREGCWPGELASIRGLERKGCLRLLATRDHPEEGRVTATYVITPEGRKAAEAERATSASAGSGSNARDDQGYAKRDEGQADGRVD
jgi:hypothetical protein